MYSLPPAKKLDIRVFSELFSDTTNSYKYLFFQSILVKLLENDFRVTSINLKDLIDLMLKRAEYPINVCKLSFGKQDQMSKYILNRKLADQELLRYVPYRILSIFFKEEWRGAKLPEAKKEVFLLELSQKLFLTHKPIYKFIGKDVIEIHPDWLSYIKENYLIIDSWAKWHWLEYLQRKNPNVPNIASKLEEPNFRNSLKKQTQFWSEYIYNKGFSCIYSKEPICHDDFTLDHFLPWSFVGHDRIWNLIPVSASINSSKSDSLPDLKYIKPFILSHYQLITSYQELDTTLKKDKVFFEEYELDLKVNLEKDFHLETFYYHFTSTLHPLLRIARNMGFSSAWRYEN